MEKLLTKRTDKKQTLSQMRRTSSTEERAHLIEYDNETSTHDIEYDNDKGDGDTKL